MHKENLAISATKTLHLISLYANQRERGARCENSQDGTAEHAERWLRHKDGEMLMKLWRYGRTIEYIGQRYRLDGILGSGGMAEVCLAWDERTQREVAVKILKADDLDQDTLNRFMKEAAQIANWEHPHILKIYENMQIELIDASQGSVLFYIIMEYASGGDLQKRLSPGKPFPLSTTFALFHQLCDAVQHAHDHGVIHRDLKPLNILFRRPVTGSEEVMLSDFGLAVQSNASHHTFARGGTLAYMAPEQFQGNALPASDIFALGVILYQLCTGHLPFRRTIQDLRRMDPPPVPTRPSLFNPDLPTTLDEPILRALRENPAERYQTAQEFWETLALALTLAAQTLPSQEPQELLWDSAGATWPFERLASTVAALSVSQSGQTGNSLSVPQNSGTYEDGGQPQATPGTSREKQKASPGATGCPTRPTHSIPIHANSYHHDISEAAESLRSTSTFTRDSGFADQHDSSNDRSRSRKAPTTYQDFDQFSQAERSLDEGSSLDAAIMLSSLDDLSPEFSHTRLSSRPPRARSTPTLSAVGRANYAGASVITGDPASQPQRRQPALHPLKVHRKRPPRTYKLPIVPVITTLALVLLVLAILVAASVQGPLLHFFGVNSTTITLIPLSHQEQNRYALTGVTGATPDPTHRQIQAHTLTSSSSTQSTTTTATGSIGAKKATGQLTFINNTAMDITIQSAVITSTSGIQVTFAGPLVIPANPPTVVVNGIAVEPGAAGNIPTLDISQPCCARNNAIFVKNTAFTGGTDAILNQVVQQKDIERAANPLITTLTQNAQNDLQGQMKSTERLLDDSIHCSPTIKAEPDAGMLAKSVTVRVFVTCHAEAYDSAGALQLARTLLLDKASHDPALKGPFTLSGQISIALISDSPENNNSIILNIQASGIWIYRFTSTRLSQLTLLIAGKEQSEARTLLMHQTGIIGVRFDNTFSTIPSNTAEINLVVP